MSQSYKWKFPPRGGGEKFGFRNADMEHFKKNDPFVSLTREIIQNSLDAKSPTSQRPVEVTFEVESQATKSFPDLNRFLRIIDKCLEESVGNKEAESFYEKAKNVFTNPHIKILKISDINTTGLTPDTWENLVKTSGVSEKKTSTAGGSYGFGKSAPFACSQIKTIFYSSLDEDNNYLFQGKAVFQSHDDIDTGQNTQRTGYYGLDNEEIGPINNQSEIDKDYLFYKREDQGTSIFIMGMIDKNDWFEKIAISVLVNFFPALDDEKLIVNIKPDKGETIHLGKYGLQKMVDKFSSTNSYKKTDYLKEIFEAYIVTKKGDGKNQIILTQDVKDLGQVKISTYQRKDLPSRNIFYRSNGMIIENNKHGVNNCISIIEIIGEELNEFLRMIENPTHEKWEPSRYDADPDKAKDILKLINDLVRESKDELLNKEVDSEIDFSGMEKYLPDDPDLISNNADDEKIIEKISRPRLPEIKKTKILKVADKRPRKVFSGDDEGGGSIGENPGKRNPGEKKGPIGPDGPGGGDGGELKRQKFELFNLNKIRAISTSKGSYQIILSSKDDKSIFLQLTIRSEGYNYELGIESASYQNTAIDINPTNNYIGPIDLKKDQEIKINVQLVDKENLTLGVDSYELRW